MQSPMTFRQLGIEDFDPTIHGYLKRRRVVVSKSCSGCRACKLKKVKCDEARPRCKRCTRNRRDCFFDQALNVDQGPKARFADTEKPTFGRSDALLIQHCEECWDEIFHIPRNEEIMHLFKTDKLVFDVLLAISACHLHASAPRQNHDMTEAHEPWKAIQAYRDALNSFNNTTGLNAAKRLFLVGLLLNILTFVLPENEAQQGLLNIANSCIHSNEEDRFSWIDIHYGFRQLLLTTAPHQGEIMAYLSAVFMGTPDINEALPSWALSKDSIPYHWKLAFKISSSTQVAGCESEDSYLVPLAYIANLREVEPVGKNSFMFLSFLMKLDSHFRGLLRRRDPRAVWILGYWFGLMCRLPKIWWCTDRAKREYFGICTWFQQSHVEERIQDAVWLLLVKDLFHVARFYY